MLHSMKMLADTQVLEHEQKFNADVHLPSEARTVTKHPTDYGRIYSIFKKRKDVRAIVMIRDGRDVCVSKHPEKPDAYLVPASRWTGYANHLRRYRYLHPDRIMPVEYSRFTFDHEGIMEQVARFVGTTVERKWKDVMPTLDPAVKTVNAMCGVRPVTTDRVGVWKKPEHAERVAELYKYPEFNAELLGWGYVKTIDWLVAP